MKEISAVEWLLDNLAYNQNIVGLNEIIEKATQMEKQQIVNAWLGGYLNGESKLELKREQYYNENFKK